MVPPYSHGISRVPQYSGYSLPALHFAYVILTLSDWLPMPFCYALPYMLLSEPRVYCYSRFGLFRVRSPLLAESHFDFSSSPYLDVSVQAVPLIYLCIQYMMTGHDSGRIAPFGYLWINACLRLPIAYRSLLRPSSAPSAKAFPLRSL